MSCCLRAPPERTSGCLQGNLGAAGEAGDRAEKRLELECAMETADRKKVLIVDDEEDMIWSLQKNLPNDNLQVAILTASSGNEALAILQKTEVDLIITDIKMPGISGIDLLIAARKACPGIAVIVMTAYPSAESKNEVMENGGLCFIEKPFDINQMRCTIRQALHQGSSFEGKVSGLQLTDIIQVNRLSQASTALRIRADGAEGTLYFSEGSIVHATCGDLEGEEAFYRIINFKGGQIEAFFPPTLPETTIDTPVDVLLLKGTMMADEQEQADRHQADGGTADGTGGGPPGVAGGPAAMDFFAKEYGMDELKQLLTEFTGISGVNTACLVGRDGFLLESIALSGVDTEMIGAIASSGFGASEAMGNQLQKGGMSMTMVEYENGPVMLSPVGSEAFLVIIADKDANLGMIRLKIKKHVREIEEKAGV